MPARADLYVNDFDQIIEQKGMLGVWEQSTVCTCLSQETGQPDFNCKLCNGSGFIYYMPQRIKILTTALSGKPETDNIGYREPGTAYGTPPSSVIMGYKDRVLFPDFHCKFSQLVSWDGRKRSSRLQKPVAMVLYLTDGKQVYNYGEDFIISEVDRRHLIWLNVKTHPRPKALMSITYMTHPSYIVEDIIHELRATYVKLHQPQDKFFELPKQYLLKREDFIYTQHPANVDEAYDILEPDEVDTSTVDGTSPVCSVCPISQGCAWRATNGSTDAVNVGSCRHYRNRDRDKDDKPGYTAGDAHNKSSKNGHHGGSGKP